jgi:hypothetical protein
LSVSFETEEGNSNYLEEMLTIMRQCAERRFDLSQVNVKVKVILFQYQKILSAL